MKYCLDCNKQISKRSKRCVDCEKQSRFRFRGIFKVENEIGKIVYKQSFDRREELKSLIERFKTSHVLIIKFL